ncbi:MAG: sigma-70 family RNA polymerase sigma factor [Alphaproteobacteria bacterium]|nr:sigma-70 family RNA polymerase sigma factor [Alphaproteobacteria bacterium]
MTQTGHSMAIITPPSLPTTPKPSLVSGRQQEPTEQPIEKWRDEHLLTAIASHHIQGGNTQAGTIFVRRHLSYVVRVCQSRLQNMAEAEEAAQDVFLSVWKNAHTWQSGNAKVTTWLYRIASNRAIDILRRRRITTDIDAMPDMADDTDIEAAEIIANQNRLIRTALASLSPDQQNAIELVYYKEMKQGEAAAQMNISLAALESTLRRGRKKLHDYLAEYHAQVRLI